MDGSNEFYVYMKERFIISVMELEGNVNPTNHKS